MKNKSNINRRDFIKYSSLAALPLTLNSNALFALENKGSKILSDDNDKILVLIQLQGGNDGLASLYNSEQYDNLQSVRSNIIIPENDIISLDGRNGFHPSMSGMKNVWDNENLGIVQSVGYPNQNRSHFRSGDIWHSASEADEYLSSGWIGRYYDIDYYDYPEGYPNENNPHPFALTIGNIVSETCQGVNAHYSMALNDPYNPGTAMEGISGEIPENCYGDSLIFINETVEQTNAYAEVISEAAGKGSNLSTKYELYGNSDLGNKLKSVALLISGGLQTKVYIVQLGGFDTHDNQVVAGQTGNGRHSDLLKEMSDAIDAFQDDLELMGKSERVVGMTYSEFGRRIRSNGALGTDHGTAAPMFLFGSCVENQILGDTPIIDRQIGINEGIPMQYDFRNIYGTILLHWFGAGEKDIQNILHPEFNPLPLFKDDCINNTSVAGIIEEPGLIIYPNPAADHIVIDFTAYGKSVRITLFDAMGGTVKIITNNYFDIGKHSINANLADLATGSYFVHFESESMSKTRKFVKI